MPTVPSEVKAEENLPEFGGGTQRVQQIHLKLVTNQKKRAQSNIKATKESSY